MQLAGSTPFNLENYSYQLSQICSKDLYKIQYFYIKNYVLSHL